MSDALTHSIETEAMKKEAEALLKSGKVGCVVLAGGLGSRFGSEKPKGTCPISAVKHKSLFELIADRVRVQSTFGPRPAFAIMTSEATHDATLSFFSAHHYFGLHQKEIDFFTQRSLPLLDDNGNEVHTKDRRILTAPCGNGQMAWDLYNSGILEKWKRRGVECIVTIVVDNPLADPFDRLLIGFHSKEKNEITAVGVLRDEPEEPLGVFMDKRVVEYSEIEDEEKKRRLPDGTLAHPIGNISFFVFSCAFLEAVARQPCALPLHKVKKNISKEQQRALGKEARLWKSEYFIFDMLPLAKSISLLVMPREACFAPLKNASGKDSVEQVQKALIARDRKIFESITQMHIDESTVLELAPEFLYPIPGIEQKWQAEILAGGRYIST